MKCGLRSGPETDTDIQKILKNSFLKIDITDMHKVKKSYVTYYVPEQHVIYVLTKGKKSLNFSVFQIL